MRDGIVHRRGRTRHVSNAEMRGRNECFSKFICPLLSVALVVGMPAMLYTKEAYFRDQQVAFDIMEDRVVPLHSVDGSDVYIPEPDDMGPRLVQYTSPYDATVSDPAFGLTFEHALGE